jgi:hypothetical protein
VRVYGRKETIHDVKAKKITGRVNTGEGPNWIVFTPDGKYGFGYTGFSRCTLLRRPDSGRRQSSAEHLTTVHTRSLRKSERRLTCENWDSLMTERSEKERPRGP